MPPAARRVVVDTLPALRDVAGALQKSVHIAVDIEALQAADGGGMGHASLVQLRAADQRALLMGAAGDVFIVDALALGHEAVGTCLKAPLEAAQSVKMLYDFRQDYRVLRQQFGIVLPKTATLDVQLMLTAKLWKAYGMAHRHSLEDALKRQLDLTMPDAVKARMRGGEELWAARPLTDEGAAYAASGVEHVDALWRSLRAHYQHGRALSGYAYAQAEAHYEAGGGGSPVADPASVGKAAAVVDKEWLHDVVGAPGRCPTCCEEGHPPELCRFNKRPADKPAAKAAAVAQKEPVRSPEKPVLKCTFCGGTGHTEAHCYKKKTRVFKCEYCGELGHTRQFCRHLGLAKAGRRQRPATPAAA